VKNIDKINKDFRIPPIPKNANLVNLPDEYYSFFRFLIDNGWGYEVTIKLEFGKATEERQYYEDQKRGKI